MAQKEKLVGRKDKSSKNGESRWSDNWIEKNDIKSKCYPPSASVWGGCFWGPRSAPHPLSWPYNPGKPWVPESVNDSDNPSWSRGAKKSELRFSTPGRKPANRRIKIDEEGDVNRIVRPTLRCLYSFSMDRALTLARQ